MTTAVAHDRQPLDVALVGEEQWTEYRYRCSCGWAGEYSDSIDDALAAIAAHQEGPTP